MRREKKPVGRWIGEALLIFLSVFGAFQLDSLRDDRNQEKQYLRHLKDFQSDLIENQGKFNYELSTTYNPRNGRGYIQGNIDKFDFIDSLMHYPTRANADTLISMINNNAIIGLTKWIFTSPQYEKLDSEYYSDIRNDSLKFRIQMHYRNNESRIKLKNDINEYVAEYQDIEDQMNLDLGPIQANRNILFSNLSKNKLRRLRRAYVGLGQVTQGAKTSDSLLLVQVEYELQLWGEDISN